VICALFRNLWRQLSRDDSDDSWEREEEIINIANFHLMTLSDLTKPEETSSWLSNHFFLIGKHLFFPSREKKLRCGVSLSLLTACQLTRLSWRARRHRNEFSSKSPTPFARRWASDSSGTLSELDAVPPERKNREEMKTLILRRNFPQNSSRSARAR
jgi:hypothetical protein